MTARLEIRRLVLRANDPAAMLRFYRDRLGMSEVAGSARSPAVRAGGTEIVFEPGGGPGLVYHFAFNIPENMLAASKRWLAERAPPVPLLRGPDGSEEHAFETWRAHAVYFRDPGGNIVEFIARHGMRNGAAGEFSSRHVLGVSEIGIVVDDVPAGAEGMRGALGLAEFPRPGSRSEGFAALGDDGALLIVVRRGRPWYPTDSPSAPAPTRVEMVGDRDAVVIHGGCEVRMSAG